MTKLCFQKLKIINSDSEEALNSKTNVIFSIFKERPACIIFDYPSYCNLESKLCSNCRPLSIEQAYKCKLQYKFAKKTPIYNCVLKSLEFAGFTATESKFKGNLVLSALPKPKNLKYLNRYQKHNHFPGSWHLGRKDNL